MNVLRRMDKKICDIIGIKTHKSIGIDGEELYLDDGLPFTIAPKYTTDIKATMGLINIIKNRSSRITISCDIKYGLNQWICEVYLQKHKYIETDISIPLAVSKVFIEVFEDKS